MKVLLILALLLIDFPAWAGVAYDTFSQSACTGCSGDSFSHTTTGSDTFMLCGGGYDDGTNTVDVFTYDTSQALTLENTDTEGSRRVIMYKRIAPTSGAHLAEITYSGAVNSTLGCLTFTGVHQVSPVGTSGISSDTSGALSVPITVAANGMGASFAVYSDVAGSCNDSTTTQTERFEICNDTFADHGMGSTTTSTGSFSMDWTFADASYGAMAAVPINQAAAAATVRRKAIVIE